MNDYIFMQEALIEANKAFQNNEIPIGSVIVYSNQIIARSFNQTVSLNRTTAHAEILAIEDACKFLNNYRLINCTLYTTIEPCLMCAGAILNSRIKRLVFGAKQPKTGAICSILETLKPNLFNHNIEIIENILEKECRILLQHFFKIKRGK